MAGAMAALVTVQRTSGAVSLVTLASALTMATALPSQTAPTLAALDVTGYRLDLHLDPAARELRGTATLTTKLLRAGDELGLDLDAALSVSAVHWQGRAVGVRRAANRLRIDAPEFAGLAVGTELELAITYQGSPRAAIEPPWRGGFVWATTAAGQPWLANVGLGDGGQLWFPCVDDRGDLATFELRLAAPRGLVVASSGVLLGEPAEHDPEPVWHWRTDRALLPSQLAIAVGPFAILRETFVGASGAPVPVQWFVLPEHTATARQRLPQFLDQLRVFEARFGPYPYAAEKYGLVEVPHVGSAHPSLLAYGGGWREDQFDAAHAGLLARQWWGNHLVVGAWRDLWLQEGFASYAQLLVREARFGPAAYWKELWRLRSVDRAPLVPTAASSCLELRRRPGGIAELQHKGARVLQALRWQLGDERFFGLLAAWASRAAAGADASLRLVTTDDFVAHCERFAGEELRWFFAAYLSTAALPVLTAEKQDGVVRFTWQTQLPATAGAFALEVPVRVGGTVQRVAMPGGRGELVVGDREYSIDPDLVLFAVRGPGVR